MVVIARGGEEERHYGNTLLRMCLQESRLGDKGKFVFPEENEEDTTNL